MGKVVPISTKQERGRSAFLGGVFKLGFMSPASVFQRTKKRQKTNMKKTHTSMRSLIGSAAIH